MGFAPNSWGSDARLFKRLSLLPGISSPSYSGLFSMAAAWRTRQRWLIVVGGRAHDHGHLDVVFQCASNNACSLTSLPDIPT